jgi:LysM repeat protein
MNKFFGLALFIMMSSVSLINAQQTTVEEYIKKWEDVAVLQMIEHGIPASITMAQGILESGYGNSMLAVKANNHFGIKCHDWRGASILKDDDKRNECFRKYDNAGASYEDHSAFLTGRSRYDFLFDLDDKDYKAWAKGLKKAGYATNPKYPHLLIDLIEKHELYKLDEKINFDEFEPEEKNTKSDQPSLAMISPKDQLDNPESKLVTSNKHDIFINQNRTKYVVAKSGDTFYQIAKEFGFHLRQLNNWNDFPNTKDILVDGDIVYIMPKRNKSKNGITRVEVEANQELWEVSQAHGIKLKSLMQLNNIDSPDLEMSKGDIVFLK